MLVTGLSKKGFKIHLKQSAQSFIWFITSSRRPLSKLFFVKPLRSKNCSAVEVKTQIELNNNILK